MFDALWFVHHNLMPVQAGDVDGVIAWLQPDMLASVIMVGMAIANTVVYVQLCLLHTAQVYLTLQHSAFVASLPIRGFWVVSKVDAATSVACCSGLHLLSFQDDAGDLWAGLVVQRGGWALRRYSAVPGAHVPARQYSMLFMGWGLCSCCCEP